VEKSDLNQCQDKIDEFEKGTYWKDTEKGNGKKLYPVRLYSKIQNPFIK